ncbi:MAG TPA: FtsX-like permease family protein, partial [Cyclobacteriaceae bacterium]|nr:FtsX-like permease family protein [Cyclobacteriaceae bacterium]
PEVENAVSLTPVWGPGLTLPDRLVKYGDKWFEESRIYAADTSFFKIFDFKLVEGNPITALKDIGSVIISRSIARKYFGDEDPMNKMITINFNQDFNFRITGIMEDIPRQSHFHFDFLLSYPTLKLAEGEGGEWFTWNDFGHFNYLLLKDGTSPRDLESKMIAWSEKYIQYDSSMLESLHRGEIGFGLQPISGIHLHSRLKWELEPNGDITYIYIFSALGLFILLIACINFTNLSIAKTSGRLTEIGIKKIAGASGLQIKTQFMTEAVFTALLSFLTALILFEVVAPSLRSLSGKPLIIDYAAPVTWISGAALIMICGILSGFYPAIILSRLATSNIIKGKTSSRFQNAGLGSALLVFQFFISIFLIIVTFIISDQTRMLRNKKLGFDSNQVIAVPIKDTLELRNYEFVKSSILEDSRIANISAVSNIPGRNFNQNPIRWKGSDRDYSASELKVDEDFFETLDLKILEGRGFSKDFPSDVENAFILNKTAAALYEWESPLNEDIIWYDDEITRTGKVIGVVEDFHFQSLRSGIEPLIIHFFQPDFNYFLIRINSGDITSTLVSLKSKFSLLDPNHPFTYFFLDEDFARLYEGEMRMQKVTGYFTILALLISCIGLFGLSSFSIEKRTKEIGIRKVNGATAFDITKMLSADFIKWVVLAFILACPVAWLFSDQWLQNFSVKIEVSWIIYLLTGMAAVVLALLTVLFQSRKAALKNPVDILRNE